MRQCTNLSETEHALIVVNMAGVGRHTQTLTEREVEILMKVRPHSTLALGPAR